MKKSRKYRFYEKPQSYGGKFALIMAGLSVLLFFVSVFISFRAGGKAGLAAGAPALIGMLFGCAPLFSACGHLRKKTLRRDSALPGL